MIKRFILSLLATLLLGVALPISADTLYKSVDSQGRVTYTDKAPSQGKAKQLSIKNQPSTPLPDHLKAALLKKNIKKDAKIERFSSVTLYQAAWCGYCKQAMAYLNKKGIAYAAVDIDTESGMNAYAQDGGGSGVPLLVADGRQLQGFSEGSYDAFFTTH